ncbi:MAG TPA: hypothetical protein VE954_16555 [Oligoflexus sp.]|uniref:hypothetical protein n=1 Tax=Oligoflexus sp. TaxID=1971216 RepID=UPI002D6C4FF7|nr:hypothetical protein [Oligoflexus sp.]HYX34710.1 hypothetical protein [Oligoflexus sp.]
MGKLRLSLGCIILSIIGILPLHAQTVTDPWDFYWQRFIEPEALTEAPDYKISGSSGWNKLLDKTSGKPLGPEGYGTYRLELTQLSPRKDGYELHFPFLSAHDRPAVHVRVGCDGAGHPHADGRREAGAWQCARSRGNDSL